jgi:hypothetical protein
MAREFVHIFPNSSRGGWNVKKSSATRASVHTETKNEAVKVGRVISQRTGSELVVHGQDGRIQRADSHGHNPCPPKDRH